MGKMSNLSPDLHQIILRIYDTAADPSVWQNVLNEIVDSVGAQGAVIFEWQDRDGNKALTAPFFSSFYSEAALGLYIDKYQALEAADQAILRHHTQGGDTVDLIDDTVLANSIEELQQQEHVKKLRKLGVFRRAAGVLNKDNPWISLFSIQMGVDKQTFCPQKQQYLSQLLPHVAKAYDLGLPMRQLDHLRSGALAAIDRLTIGICVLDKAGRVVLMNNEFKRQTESYKKFSYSPDGKLRLDNSLDQKNFTALVGHVLQHGKFGARPRKEAIEVSTDSFLCIEVTPATQFEELGSSPLQGYVVYSTDTSLPFRCNTDSIQTVFGLTDTELAIVEAIGEGLSNPEIAERRGRSVETVNTQVKSVLSKSNCHTRTQLVRMMMRFGTNFLSPEAPAKV